jgi:hypothetical protein
MEANEIGGGMQSGAEPPQIAVPCQSTITVAHWDPRGRTDRVAPLHLNGMFRRRRREQARNSSQPPSVRKYKRRAQGT